jgi:hypothetical protein
MAMYKKKIVTLPKGMEIGSKIGIYGEGDETFTVTDILYDSDGEVTDIKQSSGCRESLCKLYLLNDMVAAGKKENRVSAAIGECDKCGYIFQDSCVYSVEDGSILCRECSSKIRDDKTQSRGEKMRSAVLIRYLGSTETLPARFQIKARRFMRNENLSIQEDVLSVANRAYPDRVVEVFYMDGDYVVALKD